jgi:ArsR family metal-binding transcriptional regulator
MYGLGIILEPDVECKGCFKQHCEATCMELIRPGTVLESCVSLLSRQPMST